jgi:hypothetical protein
MRLIDSKLNKNDGKFSFGTTPILNKESPSEI